jgi:Fe2+ transport system protein FeoA
MSIIDCPINKIYKIKKIHTKGVLKQRLMSFGIFEGEDIIHLAHSIFHNTYKIQILNTQIALRREEAKSIEVHKIA